MESRVVLEALVVVMMTLSSAMALKEHCHPDDKAALLSILKSFDNQFPSWDPNTDCCRSWYGVKCGFNYRVKYLLILGPPIGVPDTFTGVIPDAVGDLPGLSGIRFHRNKGLTGNIPSSVTKLQSLTFADFSWNSLSGPIPTFFHHMKSLTALDLSFNSFSGTIPPELGLAPAINALDLSRNLLTGPIPASFGRFNQSGSSFILILSHNQLSGPIPSSMGKLDYSRMELGHNNITGDASLLFGRNKSVNFLYLSRNQLAFDFSKVVFPPEMTALDVSHNKIYGELAPTAGWEHLYFFNFTYNRLCGPIPQLISNRSSFDPTLFSHNKCICGPPPLPPCKSTT